MQKLITNTNDSSNKQEAKISVDKKRKVVILQVDTYSSIGKPINIKWELSIDSCLELILALCWAVFKFSSKNRSKISHSQKIKDISEIVSVLTIIT